jgi:hypothetical protein
MTAPVITGRIWTFPNCQRREHAHVLFTGNGATISPDLRRRLLHVELFARRGASEDRRLAHARRARNSAFAPEILAPCGHYGRRIGLRLIKTAPKDYSPGQMSFVESWKMPGLLSMPRAPTAVSGDRDTEEMQKLVEVMPPKVSCVSVGCGPLPGPRCFIDSLAMAASEETSTRQEDHLRQILAKFDGDIRVKTGLQRSARGRMRSFSSVTRDQLGQAWHCWG